MCPFLRIKVNAEKCIVVIKPQAKQRTLTLGNTHFVMLYLLEYHITGTIIDDFASCNIISLQVIDMALRIRSEIMDMVCTLCVIMHSHSDIHHISEHDHTFT